jgi:hypothetical protein
MHYCRRQSWASGERSTVWTFGLESRECWTRFTRSPLNVHSQSILSACSFMGDCDSVGPDIIRVVWGLLLAARGWNRGCVLIILHSCMAWQEVNRSRRCARLRFGFAAHVKSSAITNDKCTPPEFWHGFCSQHIRVRLDELSLSVATYTFFCFLSVCFCHRYFEGGWRVEGCVVEVMCSTLLFRISCQNSPFNVTSLHFRGQYETNPVKNLLYCFPSDALCYMVWLQTTID